MIALAKRKLVSPATVQISGSKSETNRLLILQALYPNLSITNSSTCDDSIALQNALSEENSIINVGHAGTTMRFLTAYLAQIPGKNCTLTGSSRMQERPIHILVDALRQLGANISYLGKQGFPPLKIEGKTLQAQKIEVKAGTSSQFISALCLIAPKLNAPLHIQLQGNITSLPYLEMTLKLLKKIGVKLSFENKVIKIHPLAEIKNQHIAIASDWSSASYFYSMVALQKNSELNLSFFNHNSLQGDAKVIEIYKKFGVHTSLNQDKITLRNTGSVTEKYLSFNLNDTPDLAQTIAVTCLAKGVSCRLTGLATLKIKETDRLQALKNELEKFGTSVSITDDSLEMNTQRGIPENITVNTYNDHRMAMAFAPLSLLGNLSVENPEVVTKSYPNFWIDFRSITKDI
ncbi:MAG: 3-phosphoshikimate 1-carboxyvinyltransferase [Bacteroidota bacterium]